MHFFSEVFRNVDYIGALSKGMNPERIPVNFAIGQITFTLR